MPVTKGVGKIRVAEDADDNAVFVKDVHDKGLGFDLVMMNRRKALGLAGGAALLAFVGSSRFAATPAVAADTCVDAIPTETNGPYPADGTTSVDILDDSGIVRSDIRSSFGDSTTTAPGIPMTLSLTLLNADCTPMTDAAVYVWHCDRDGNYSMYSTGITSENYLRGVQVTDSSGQVSFTSIFPACYLGRWPHIHFEVYSSLSDISQGASAVYKVSQVALPQDVCDDVYATTGYSSSVSNLSQITLATDNVFSDGYSTQMATVTGNVNNGYAVSLTVNVGSGSGSTSSPTGSPTGEPTGVPTGPPTGEPTSAPTVTETVTATHTVTETQTVTATETVTTTETVTPTHPGRSTHIKRPPWPRRRRDGAI